MLVVRYGLDLKELVDCYMMIWDDLCVLVVDLLVMVGVYIYDYFVLVWFDFDSVCVDVFKGMCCYEEELG